MARKRNASTVSDVDLLTIDQSTRYFSNVDNKVVDRIVTKYGLAKELVKVPFGDECAHNPPPGYYAWSGVHCSAGASVPFASYYREFIDFLGIAPFQLAPNSYLILAALRVLFDKLFGRVPTHQEIIFLFDLKNSSKHKSSWFLQSHGRFSFKFVNTPTKLGNQYRDYFFVQGMHAVHSSFQVPTNVVRPKSNGALEEMKSRLEILTASERDSAILVTDEILHHYGLLCGNQTMAVGKGRIPLPTKLSDSRQDAEKSRKEKTALETTVEDKFEGNIDILEMGDNDSSNIDINTPLPTAESDHTNVESTGKHSKGNMMSSSLSASLVERSQSLKDKLQKELEELQRQREELQVKRNAKFKKTASQCTQLEQEKNKGKETEQNVLLATTIKKKAEAEKSALLTIESEKRNAVEKSVQPSLKSDKKSAVEHSSQPGKERRSDSHDDCSSKRQRHKVSSSQLHRPFRSVVLQKGNLIRRFSYPSHRRVQSHSPILGSSSYRGLAPLDLDSRAIDEFQKSFNMISEAFFLAKREVEDSRLERARLTEQVEIERCIKARHRDEIDALKVKMQEVDNLNAQVSELEPLRTKNKELEGKMVDLRSELFEAQQDYRLLMVQEHQIQKQLVLDNREHKKEHDELQEKHIELQREHDKLHKKYDEDITRLQSEKEEVMQNLKNEVEARKRLMTEVTVYDKSLQDMFADFLYYNPNANYDFLKGDKDKILGEACEVLAERARVAAKKAQIVKELAKLKEVVTPVDTTDELNLIDILIENTPALPNEASKHA